MYIFLIQIVSFVVLLVFIVIPLVTISVYGRPIKNADALWYLRKNVHKYELNDYSRDLHLLYCPGMPWISKLPKTTLFSWHIKGQGVIWRGSSASKMLNDYHETLVERFRAETGLIKPIIQ